mmetsp:Transcript_42929/g.106824  ORF Transcript_42929/g.106824 Transcript_42929/m.106824 type:complete len:313 (+) Transcript_42929:571-1509(+)
MKGRMGSLSAATRACILASRIMKLVADVSSSINSEVHPASSASMIAAACEVEPEASSELKVLVRLPNGKLSINGEMSQCVTARPSSARTFTAFSSVTTLSRPSPGILSYTPTCIASSSVDLPWNPPPTMIETPRLTPIPSMTPAFGTVIATCSSGGDANGTATAADIGRSEAPEARGKMEPLATNATSPSPKSCARAERWSSTESRWRLNPTARLAWKYKASFTTSGSAAARICEAHSPSTERPRAGRAMVKRASRSGAPPERSRTTEDRSSTCWPGWSMSTSPPFCPDQPPASVRLSSPRRCAVEKKRRVM